VQTVVTGQVGDAHSVVAAKGDNTVVTPQQVGGQHRCLGDTNDGDAELMAGGLQPRITKAPNDGGVMARGVGFEGHNRLNRGGGKFKMG
jgi:hypothetical protein